MSTISTAYMDVCKAIHDYDVWRRQHLQVYTGIRPATEGALSSIADTVIRFLKNLKYHISKIVRSIINWVAKLISYDNYITVKTMGRSKRIEKIYSKCDATTRMEVDKTFASMSMSACWQKEDFESVIHMFEILSKVAHTDMVKALESDISAIVSKLMNSAFLSELTTIDNLYGIKYDFKKQDFVSIESKYPLMGGKTISELGISNISDVVNLCTKYEKALVEYRKLDKLTATLHKLEYQLDISIRNTKQDPLVAENIKQDMTNIQKDINLFITITKKYIDLVKGISSSINTKLSVLLNLCRQAFEQHNAMKEKATESLLETTTIVVTSDKDYNKTYAAVQKVVDVIKELINSEMYKDQLFLRESEDPLYNSDQIKQFCKGEIKEAVLPLALINYPYDTKDLDNWSAAKSLLEDINRCIQDTELSVYISENGFVVSKTGVPDMYVALERAEYLLKI